MVDNGKRSGVAFELVDGDGCAAEGGWNGGGNCVSGEGGGGDDGGEGIELEIERGEGNGIGFLPCERDGYGGTCLTEAAEIFQDDGEIYGGGRGGLE